MTRIFLKFDPSSSLYRFNGDMGGRVARTPDTDPVGIVKSTLTGGSPFDLPGTKHIQPIVENYTNADPAKAKGSKVVTQTSEGFVITREDGFKYYYYKKLNTRGEVNLQIGCAALDNLSDQLVLKPCSLQRASGGAYTFSDDALNAYSGDIQNAAYTSSYLLTKITGPDYQVDKDGKEFGYVIKFRYRDRFDFERSDDSYYRSRKPYTGLNYNHGDVSNRRDQMAAFQSSEREIAYLSEIETPTHLAYFVTNKAKYYQYQIQTCDSCTLSNFWAFIKTGATLGLPAIPVVSGFSYKIPLQAVQCQRSDIFAIRTQKLRDYYNSLSLPIDYSIYAFSSIDSTPTLSCSFDNRRFFLNGSMTERKDAMAAPKVNAVLDPAATATGVAFDTSLALEYLERVVVFSKFDDFRDSLLRPLTTTHFSYDYSLAPNQPNSTLRPGSTTQRLGKLTLLRVFSDGDDKISQRVAPFVFEYAHRRADDYPNVVSSRFGNILPVSRTGVDQNPAYAASALDAWQDLAPYSSARKAHLIDSRWQGNTDPATGRLVPSWAGSSASAALTPDPGAYKLKRIRLPGGGEVLVDYEAKDYALVQDKPACTLTSLLEAKETSGNSYVRNPTYSINPADLGIEAFKPIPGSLSGAALAAAQRRNAIFLEQWKLIKSMYEPSPGKSPERIYFKFLYKLNNQPGYAATGPASVRDCHSEFIDGYARVQRVDTASWPATNNRQEVRILITLEGGTTGKPKVPRTACLDYYATHHHGMNVGNDCIGAAENLTAKIFDGGPSYTVHMDDYIWKLCSADALVSLPARISAVLPLTAWMIKEAVLAGTYAFPPKTALGASMDLSLSGFRIPMLAAKKGGGARVKSLLFYESGLEGGEAALFGKEYVYKTFVPASEDGKYRITSSGVASNEPPGSREENPLITYLPKADQSFLNRLAVGEDREQLEGPVGETLLPGATVGYSKVYVRDIGGQRHGLGYDVNEFYTYNQYPTNGLLVNTDAASGSFLSDKGVPTVTMSNLAAGTEKDRFNIGGGGGFKAGIVSINFQLGLDISKLWTSQSFRFVSTDFVGKPTRSATYSDTLASMVDFARTGEYLTADALEPATAVGEQMTEYYGPGEPVQLASSLTDALINEIPGRESDLIVERRSSSETRLDPRFSFDLNVWGPAFNPTFSCALAFNLADKTIYSQTVAHTVHLPAIVKRQIVRDNQVSKKSENRVFDGNTGQPILTASYDSYNKPLYTLTVPAYFMQPGMGRQGSAEAVRQQLTVPGASLVTYDQNPFYPPSSTAGQGMKTTLTNLVSAQFQNYRNAAVLSPGSDPTSATATGYAYSKSGFVPTGTLPANPSLPCYSPSEALAIATSAKEFDRDHIEEAGLMQTTLSRTALTDSIPNRTYDQTHFLRTSVVSRYGPGAKGVENLDALGYAKSTQYIDQAQLEVGTTVLAPVGASAFYDFEPARQVRNIYAPTPDLEIVSEPHTGTSSIRMPPSTTMSLGGPTAVACSSAAVSFLLYPSSPTLGTRYEIQLWARRASGEFSALPLKARVYFKGLTPYEDVALAQVARSEDWVLLKGEIDLASHVVAGGQECYLGFIHREGSAVFLDDVRIQPVGTEMNCSVLDRRRLKVLATFDDNHFGTLYQYDAEGRLIRKIKETVAGRVTLSESVSTQPEVPRIFKP